MPKQHTATLLGATCCVRLATVLRGHVGCCWLKSDHFQTWASNTQHVATHRNTVAKRTQHVAPNSVVICCVGMLRSFGQDFRPNVAWKSFFLSYDSWISSIIIWRKSICIIFIMFSSRHSERQSSVSTSHQCQSFRDRVSLNLLQRTPRSTLIYSRSIVWSCLWLLVEHFWSSSSKQWG